MTPFEALTGQFPSVNHFRVWGCRAWVKTKIGRKQFDEKAVEGIFVGYSRQPIGWEINIPSLGKNVTSIFVSFEENEPPGTEQTNRHTAAQVPIVQGERTLKEYDYLIGKQHIDDEDGLLYQVTRIGERRGVIVAWSGLVTASGKIAEGRVPIHIFDIGLPRQLEQQEQKKSLLCWLIRGAAAMKLSWTRKETHLLESVAVGPRGRLEYRESKTTQEDLDTELSCVRAKIERAAL